MVATAPEVGEVVRSILHELKSTLRVDKLILFGSYVSGRPQKWSDIDLAVISPDFSDIPIWRRQEMLAEALPESDVRLSPIGYSPEDLAKPTPFLREIIRTGRVVYPKPEA